MPRILHLIDSDEPQELRLALRPLIDRLPCERWQQSVAALSGRHPAPDSIRAPLVAKFPPRFGAQILNLPLLQRCVFEHRIDLIHAWSLKAACAAALAVGDSVPLALTRWDPMIEAVDAVRLAALNEHHRLGVLCHTAMVRRRLIERGMDASRSAVVRPGVDLSVINQSKRGELLRKELQIKGSHRVVLLPPPPSRRGGHLDGLWVVEMATRLMPELLLLLPGLSAEQRKIANYLRSVPNEAVVRMTGEKYPFEGLLGLADLLLCPAVEDISTTPIAWAMAGSVPILACATYSVTEFIADSNNGHLVKPGHKAAMMGKLIEVLRNRSRFSQAYDLARAQAFESFGMSRYVEQVEQSWRNLLACRAVGQDLVDSAIDG